MILMKKRLIIFSLIFLILVISCVKNEEEQNTSKEPEEDIKNVTQLTMTDNEQPDKSLPDDRLEDRPEQMSRPSALNEGTSEKKVEAEPLPMSSQEKLSRRRLGTRILPEDMEIGPLYLGHLTSDNAFEAGAMKVAENFLSSLLTGKVDNKYISVEDLEYIREVMFPLENGDIELSEYRLGVPVKDENDCFRMNVRFFGEPGRTAGEVFVCKEQDDWKITDFQVDLLQLKESYIKDYEVFEPEVYRWLEIF